MNPTLSQAEAKRRGMVSITEPMAPEDETFAVIIADMKRVSGTVWAVVKIGDTEAEVWRVPAPIPSISFKY